MTYHTQIPTDRDIIQVRMFFSIVKRLWNHQDRPSNEMTLAIAIYESSDIMWDKAKPTDEMIAEWKAKYRNCPDFNLTENHWTRRLLLTDEAHSRHKPHYFAKRKDVAV